MKYYGGISLLVHIAIILVKWIRENTRSAFIITTIFTVIFTGAGFSIANSFSSGSNIELISDLLHRCERIERQLDGSQLVVLRIDDVQAFAWHDISIRMIDEALGRNIPLALGTIPLGLEEDKEIVRYLKRNNCNLELALHGWNNRIDIPEFGSLTEAEARIKIEKGKPILERIDDEPIITFIPPNNVYSQGTAAALEKEGFKIISSEGDGPFDYTAATFDFYLNEIIAASDVIGKCREAFRDSEACIIMLHPQDYAAADGSLDLQKYQNYIALLDLLNEEGASFVTFEDIFLANGSQKNQSSGARSVSGGWGIPITVSLLSMLLMIIY